MNQAKLKKIMEDNSEKLTANGNLPIKVEVDIFEYNTTYDKFELTVYSEEVESDFKLSIVNREMVGPKDFQETEKSIKRADEMCEKVFGCTYEDLGDRLNKYEELDLFLSPYGKVIFEDYEPRKEYQKLKKSIPAGKMVTVPLTDLVTDDLCTKLEFVYDKEVEGGLYCKQFFYKNYIKPKAKWRTSGDAELRARINLLKLFGTSNPKFKKGMEITFYTEMNDKTGKPFIVVAKVSGYEKELAKYEECVEQFESEKEVDNVAYLISIGEWA